MVLYAIEKQRCVTVPDVKEIVERLKSKDLIYVVRRYVPLSSRPYFALKSRRIAKTEADKVFAEAETTAYQNMED